MSNLKKIYFSAGPAMIPREVMEHAHSEFLNYRGLDISVAEMSHRSQEFNNIITETEKDLRELMDIPDDYAVLFMQGGAKAQFDSVAMNLCSILGASKVDYIVNGTWSKLAAKDAEKYARVSQQSVQSEKFNRVPSREELVDHKDATYRYFCDNETIQGLEFNYVPESGIPLVSDMTSNFLSRPVDVRKFGVIFASAQKNCGLSGLVIVIIRKDLIGRQMPITPTMQNYKIMLDYKSVYNTPPTYAIYIAGLCFKWMLARGGLEGMDKFCREKSGLVYDIIDKSSGFYICPVEKSSRSRSNVVFILQNKDLDTKFLEEAKAAGLNDLKGHRSVGGFRTSLYHGITMEDTQRLVTFMTEFRARYSDWAVNFG